MSKLSQAILKEGQFLTSGLIGYGEEILLLREEDLAKFTSYFQGMPIMIEHDTFDKHGELNDEILNNHIVGRVCNTSIHDKWGCAMLLIDKYNAASIVSDKSTVALSPTFTVIEYGNGGVYNGIKYDKEIKDIKAEYLAIVSNPRLNDAKIYNNSITNSNNESINIMIKNLFKKEVISEDLKNNSGEYIEDTKQMRKVAMADYKEKTARMPNGKDYNASQLQEAYEARKLKNNELEAEENMLSEDDIITMEDGTEITVKDLMEFLPEDIKEEIMEEESEDGTYDNSTNDSKNKMYNNSSTQSKLSEAKAKYNENLKVQDEIYISPVAFGKAATK